MTAEIGVADVPALLAGAEFYSTSAAGEGIEFAGPWLEDILAHTGPVRLVPAAELPPDTPCAAIGGMGSTTAMAELPPSGDEPVTLARSLAMAGGRRLGAVMPLNAASVNALFPVAAAAVLGLPLIDCDGMGRVFPLIHQTTYELAGLSLSPLAVVSAGHDSLLLDTGSARAEQLARSMAQAAGGWLMCGMYQTRAGRLRDAAIHGSVSRVLEVGRVLCEGGPLDRLLRGLAGAAGASVLGGGRVVEIGPSVRQAGTVYPGNPVGMVVHDLGTGRLIRLEAHNELVLALADGALVAAVPDLLCLLDRGTLRMTGTERLAAGDLVDVLRVPAAPVWHSVPGLALGGPGAFGFPLRHPGEGAR
ncbi:hypothetical protein HNP84_002668 [Thermocatellispora tengchongensis]|uniref:DUF917 domain-containing protein n=1 Tax=Thermocatellispora tengchongensis TaxID=1073253 RepID=A0A840P6U9_9ACTN|nr:DUF917 domain-containing protein [Thermocatellispora tengchongensis]MBB5132947.1 hypothetical protein [Thermocatellispora tengchongensis]